MNIQSVFQKEPPESAWHYNQYHDINKPLASGGPPKDITPTLSTTLH